MSVYEKEVNSVKTINAAGGIAGTVMLFTPAAPIGLLVLGATAVSGIGTSAVDWIASSMKSDDLKYNLAIE
jgi:hypothetical protein